MKLVILLLVLFSANTFAESVDICVAQKKDYEFFRDAFNKEHNEVCSAGCTYTPTMNKYSDTMERIAGTYYLQDCDLTYGRLARCCGMENGIMNK